AGEIILLAYVKHMNIFCTEFAPSLAKGLLILHRTDTPFWQSCGLSQKFCSFVHPCNLLKHARILNIDLEK
ncbi:hypothetical protein ACQP3J_31790, partial [Escherichia coli]